MNAYAAERRLAARQAQAQGRACLALARLIEAQAERLEADHAAEIALSEYLAATQRGGSHTAELARLNTANAHVLRCAAKVRRLEARQLEAFGLALAAASAWMETAVALQRDQTSEGQTWLTKT